jgi:Mn2+/Fe2+ NRAMP family transporter
MKKSQWVFAAFLALLTIASIIAEFADHHAANHFWSGIPLFWILFGSIGCVLLIVFAKMALAPFLYKKEDYYNE